MRGIRARALAGIAAAILASCAGERDRAEPKLSCSEARAYATTGTASWYGRTHHGRRTANGERFDMNRLTAAHRQLPLGTKIRVTNLENGKSVVLVVNDRGPFVPGRLVDVSKRAAEDLGFAGQGTARVRITVVETCA
jgi:rare lipoprotein A